MQTVGKSLIKNSGSGPGQRTLDGCSVEFYRRLPPDNEVAKVLGAAPPPATLLELGAGCGRITRPLTAAGYQVTAVDNSADMLELIDGAETIHSDIETLQTARQYDIVLLASRIFNCPDKETRSKLLKTASTHLKQDGTFLLEVHASGILNMRAGDASADEVLATRILSSNLEGHHVAMEIEYQIDEDVWTHKFETQYLPPEQVEAELKTAGFTKVEWLNSDKSWLKVCVPASGPRASQASPGT